MRFLVDGMNLIGSRPDGWWRDRTGAMRRLAGELDAFAAGADTPVSVVFDGRPRDLGAHPHLAEIGFAPGGRNAADDEIARRVAADDAPSDMVVVTSDKELVDRVTGAGGRVESVGRFRERLDGS